MVSGKVCCPARSLARAPRPPGPRAPGPQAPRPPSPQAAGPHPEAIGEQYKGAWPLVNPWDSDRTTGLAVRCKEERLGGEGEGLGALRNTLKPGRGQQEPHSREGLRGNTLIRHMIVFHGGCLRLI